MSKWEYLTFCWSGDATKCCFALNEFGSQGWELIQVFNNIAIMKKKVEYENKNAHKIDFNEQGFEQCWIKYRRKGSKKKSYEQWKKLKSDEQETVSKHIQAYVDSVSDVKYQKDFERYLRDKCFMNVVYKNGHALFDADIDTKEEPKDKKMIINGIEYK